MKSIIICEGPTDFILLQYYMRKVNGWNEGHESKNKPKGFEKSKSRDFQKNGNVLRIICADGCSRMPNLLSKIIESNTLASSQDEFFSKIVYLTDNDEEQTKEDVFQKLSDVWNCSSDFSNNSWTKIKTDNEILNHPEIDFLPLIIPFYEQGAIETFLLQTLASAKKYDASVIDRGNKFVDLIASENEYLKHRRDITKAKLDVFFSVKTPAEQFTQRQNILKNVPWEEYENIQKSFKELKKL